MNELLERVILEAKRLSEFGDQCAYHEFVQLVELRQLLVEAFELEKEKGDLSTKQKEEMLKLKRYDPIILKHMSRLKDEAQEGLVKLNQSKKQSAAYYQQPTYESILFDKRN